MVRHRPILSRLCSFNTAAVFLARMTEGESHRILPTHQKEKEHITSIDIWSLAIPHFSFTETLIQPQSGCFQVYGLIYFRFRAYEFRLICMAKQKRSEHN